MDIDDVADDVLLLEAAVVVLVFSDEIDEETIEATTDSVVLHDDGLDTVEAIEALEAVVDVIDLDDDDDVNVDVVSVIIFDSSIAFTFSMTLVTSFEAEAEDDNECDLKAEEKDKALRIGRLPNAVNDLDPVNDECKVGSTVAVSTFSSLIKITLSLLDFLIFSGELGELALLGEALSSEDTVLGTWCSTLISYVAMVLTAVLNLGEGKEILLAKFCMKCGFLIVLILAKKFPALRFNFALWVEAALPPAPPEAAAASPWTFSEITVLKADVLVST